MELKPGYKQTEVGVIPEDWEVKALKEISPRQSVGLVINPSTYFDPNESIPMLVGSSVTENRIDAEAANRISAASNFKLAASRLTQGDLVTVRVGDPGVTAVVPPELDQCNCASMMIVRQDRSFNSHWLCSTMNSRYGRQQVENVQYGTAQKQFNIKDAVNFVYAVPPLQEQNQIATVLSEVELLLINLEQVITKKHNIKQTAMQELLTGKRRLPGFEGEWEVKRLGEIGKCHRGVSYKGEADLMPHDTANTIRLLRSNNVQDSFVKTAELKHVNSKRVATHQILTRDDIVICMANGSKALVGKAGRFQVSDGYEYTFGAFMGCFRTIPAKADPGFAFYLLQTDRYQRLIGDLLAGSSINNLKPSSVESLEFLFPERSEQQAIVAVLSDIDAELTYLAHRRDSIQEIKRGMMQQLLTGKIRLR